MRGESIEQQSLPAEESQILTSLAKWDFAGQGEFCRCY
jgi:hypothetical protein